MTTSDKPQFPIVDALLFAPKETAGGHIGVCTNTTAPGQVFNDIDETNRSAVSVLGPLIVSRDGTERMILNSLVHPAITHLILFSEESLTFSPSTNLLLALMHGLDEARGGNYIQNGQAASAHFPNLSKAILDSFREAIVVLPLFMSQNKESAKVVTEYLNWLTGRVPEPVIEFLRKANTKDKKYFDALNTLIILLKEAPRTAKTPPALNPKDFQHLQPPKVEIPEEAACFSVPFCVSQEGPMLRLDIRVGKETYFIRGEDDFRIEYSLMKFLGEKKQLLSPIQQFMIGAELNRVNIERTASLTIDPFTEPEAVRGEREIPLESKPDLKPDEQYYYKIGLKDGDTVSVMCMAFDVCESVFDLRSKSAAGIYKWLAEKNRFQEYEMDILHRMDVGGQIGRAAIAAKFGYSFIQDFSSIFKINKEKLPLLIAEGDSFLDVHRSILLKTYTEGITEEHGDARKGLSRTAVALAIYRDAPKAFEHMPAIYKQGELSTEDMREAYKEQLLRLDHDGDYSYGERTRVHFGFDQLERAKQILKQDFSRAAIVQRYDPTEDMGMTKNPDTGRLEYTHDPCLTHDIYFVAGGKLNALHIARAHNLPNAYPENLFGLHDAYDTGIREALGLSGGDLYMLSSRGNILLLTEEQRVRKIIAEPSKPIGSVDRASGPSVLDARQREPAPAGLSYISESMVPTPWFDDPILHRLRDFEGIDTVERAISYFEFKGLAHNNPVLTTHQAGKSDPQGDHLVFFQINGFGKKLCTTGVFTNHLAKPTDDLKLVSALGTAFSERLKVELGTANVFYVSSET